MKQFIDPNLLDRLRVGPLAAYLDTYLKRIDHAGFLPSSAPIQMYAIARFSNWLDSRQVNLRLIDEGTIQQFLKRDLDIAHGGESAPLHRLLTMLREIGVTAPKLVQFKDCQEQLACTGGSFPSPPIAWIDMLDAGALSSLVGYTAIASASVDGNVDGECGELIKLDNGMVFELDEDSLVSEYCPEVVVFERVITPAEAKELLNQDRTEPVAFYKLIIEDELIDASRVWIKRAKE